MNATSCLWTPAANLVSNSGMRAAAAILALSLAGLPGCAPPPRPVTTPPDLSRLLIADAQVEAGCYDCLLQARAIYEQVGAEVGRATVLPALFETDVLLALREKELALDTAPEALARARRISAELPPEAQADRYLALVALVLPDNVGTPRRELQAMRDARDSRLGSIDAEMSWLRDAPTLREPARQYLSLAVDCSFLARSRRLSSVMAAAGVWTGARAVLQAKEDVVPLVAYRAAICDLIGSRTLERVHTTVPQSAEAAYFLARPQLQASSQTGGAAPRRLLNEALARFPSSASVVYLSGNLSQLVGDCRRGLDLYDRTLVLEPAHEDAMLGRTMCLTLLGRGDEAIAQATTMIELRPYNLGEAYYWRAYNYQLRDQLQPARADITLAKPLAGREIMRFYTLAGIIEHDQNDLTVAEDDLRRAVAAGDGNCIAMSYLGMVKNKRDDHSASAGYFSTASDCYWANVRNDERALREMQANKDVDPDFKARQIASFEAALKVDRHYQYTAAFNAANEHARAGNIEQARTLLDVAANEASLAGKIAQLRDMLKEH